MTDILLALLIIAGLAWYGFHKGFLGLAIGDDAAVDAFKKSVLGE